eukprot:m.104555 g.104555  ORF g.104555 m.104555 type:complete len:55 (+) comp12640_c0_seq4:326-490(+)
MKTCVRVCVCLSIQVQLTFMFDLLCVRFVRPKLISLRLKDTKKTDKTDQQGKAN